MNIKNTLRAVLAVAALCSITVVGLVSAEDTDKALLDRAKSLFKPLPDTSRVDDYPHSAARAELGKALFYETRVSTDGRMFRLAFTAKNYPAMRRLSSTHRCSLRSITAAIV